MKIYASAMLAAALAAGAAQAEDLKMSTIAPGSSAYLTMSTMASIVNQEQDAHDLTVDATGAATKHQIDLAEGKIDFAMTSPTVHHLLKNQLAMYQKLDSAPELAERLRLVFWFPYGQYHVLTYAEDGMESLEDIRGKRVFLGPPGGGAWNAAKSWIEAQTGMVPGEDYENFKGSWSSALQAFQDKQVDVYIAGGIAPFPQVEQLAATSDLRILGPTPEEFEQQTDEQRAPTEVRGRELGIIPAGVYGEGVVNEQDVATLGAVVGVSTRADLDPEIVYEVTKAFWEGAEGRREDTPWLENVTLDYAVREGGLPLHPGAQRYYEEVGLEIPEGSQAPAE
ncbi:TAXI family TRAP transporter solute-binding subunit [Tranquillimonas alkanivorans]|uniref:TRAP transporter solute receptor, TAXI family n=1 Tax=Tranquillimonas alkanivorans TaxID=441119 RepID=A0A1I5VKG1_9RHOB|nr:TAXI family TRAP transporter solute-binding subunit [Tranquillimonas alkanivorans]SFQ07960.1 hypothetical protein SAMN04488047_13220 [Tranquillimonas alkanivorans]